MATIYKVRDGQGEGCTDEGTEVCTEKLQELKFTCLFHGMQPPQIGSEPCNPFSAFRHIVIHVTDICDQKILSNVFSDGNGYYLVENPCFKDWERIINE
ncbi:hypothetical protein MD588_18785 [Photobacterium sp. SDRW27]|uniref:hypothetical protein n=1 Tax=Photobacterium obscurum TaxID=2829490 RepID=UPI002244C8C7|nr:hypothetical protein [Photobacterium obscurum]MCW8330842.1 hypothetical protein [Photobacterium obscurum]